MNNLPWHIIKRDRPPLPSFATKNVSMKLRGPYLLYFEVLGYDKVIRPVIKQANWHPDFMGDEPCFILADGFGAVDTDEIIAWVHIDDVPKPTFDIPKEDVIP